jgi:hypothetical protein
MAWRALQSTHLNGGDYDPDTQTLMLQFVNGAVYRYTGVPQHKADTLFQSSSPGGYFHDHIRGQYTEVKIGEGSTRTGRRSTRKY